MPTAEARLQGPAIGLLITGGLGAVFWIARTVLSAVMMTFIGVAGMSDPQMKSDPNAVAVMTGIGLAGIAISLVPVAMNLAICFGAWKMMRVQSPVWSMTAAVLALIPCQPPCCLLTIPFGIWAIVTMQEPLVRDRLAQSTMADVPQVFD